MPRIYTNEVGTRFIEFSDAQTARSLSAEIATRANVENVWLNIYQVLPNPDPVLRKTGYQIEILDEIKREPHVSACATSREAGVLSRKWKVDKETASSASAEIEEKLFKKLVKRQVIREMMDAWGYGYQVSEVVWERQGDLLLPVKLIGKPSRWFMFGEENELRMKTKLFDATGVEVAPYKFLLTQYRASYDNPYGESQYSMSFWPVTFKKGGLKFWAVFLEKFGMPHAIGKLPPNAGSDERNKLLEALRLLIRDACATIPNDSTVELLEAGSITGSSDAYERFARYHDGQISTVILGHSAGADSTPGKLGGEDTAMRVRKDIIDGDCEMVADTLNTLIGWIHELNPSLGEERPVFSMFEETDVDATRADRDSKLMETGRVKLTKSYFVRKYDFDEEDIEVVDPPSTQPVQFSASPKTKAVDGQAEVDALAGGISDELLQEQIDTVLKPVRSLVEEASSYDEVRKGVAKLFPQMKTDEIVATIEKAALLADAVGRVDANA